MRIYSFFLSLSVAFCLTGCTTGFHGSFAPNTYIDKEHNSTIEYITPVKAKSCQTKVLYLFPAGPPPSTAEAIQAAKDQYEGTKFLSDISIDDRTEWEFGYSNQCITVEGLAHR